MAQLFEPTPFIGRAHELKRLERRLGEERFVTVAAGPGYGKTRLALRFALTHEKSFWGGVWFIDLRSASDIEASCLRIARALGMVAVGDEIVVLPSGRRSCAWTTPSTSV